MTQAPGARERPAVSVDVRARRAADLPTCVSLLREVHVVDGYPGTWPRHPAQWLVVNNELASWVWARGESILGHVSL